MISENNNPSEAPRHRQAFEAMLGEIQSVPEKDFVAITLDIQSVVTTVEGAWQDIRTLRTTIDEMWRDFDMELFDKLETYALALGHAQTEYATAIKSPPSLVPLVQSAVKTRKLLLDEVNVLIDFGLIDPSATSALEGTNCYKDIAFDVMALSNILKKRESKISVRSRISPAELDAAEVLADNLITAVGRRERAPNIAAEAIRNRQAAFTLLINAYEEVRAAIKYLRRKQGDADKTAPSLYESHGIRKKKKRDKDKPAEVESPKGSEVAIQTSVTATASNVPANDATRDFVAAHGPFVEQG
jgi:hypothetical protein